MTSEREAPAVKLRTVHATRYVTPLREGGSLPAIVEADDAGMYVLKFRGAGQGPKVLVAEVIVGELARTAGLAMPEIVLIELDADLARTEPDPEIQQLIRASAGLNLAFDYLPGSVTFDPSADQPDALLASSIVWLDAYTSNVDRTPRNANMLMWHRKLWLIDHGAALYFHHAWGDGADRSAKSGPPSPRTAAEPCRLWSTATWSSSTPRYRTMVRTHNAASDSSRSTSERAKRCTSRLREAVRTTQPTRRR